MYLPKARKLKNWISFLIQLILESSNNNLKCNSLPKKEWLQAGTKITYVNPVKIFKRKCPPDEGTFAKSTLKG